MHRLNVILPGDNKVLSRDFSPPLTASSSSTMTAAEAMALDYAAAAAKPPEEKVNFAKSNIHVN